MEQISELRTTIWFGKSDESLLLALNKMSLDDERSKNYIIKNALKAHLKNHGYLNDDGDYVAHERGKNDKKTL